MDMLPGLSEFRRAVGGGRGRRCHRRGGRGRGWHCGPRRGRGCQRPCGPPGMRHLARMFQNSPFAAAMQNHPFAQAMREQFCQPEEAPVDHRDPARQPEQSEEAGSDTKPQRKEMKKKVKALKKEMKAIRKEQKKLNKKEKKALKKEQKKLKKEAKKMRKQLDCEVTGHLDMDETSEQIAGAMVLKTWKVKNTGTVAWPEDTIAVFHTGY